MSTTSKILKTVVLVALLFSAAICLPGPALSAEESGRKADASKAGERYWALLLENPRYGAVFNRVYDESAQRGDVDGLLKKIDELPPAVQSGERGKRLLLRGLILIRQNDLDQGIETLKEARTAMPDNPQITAALGKSLILRGSLREGTEALESALENRLSEKERLDILNELGETYLRLGEPERADAVWGTVRKENADRPDILTRIAGIYENAGEYRKALSLYQELEESARQERDPESEIQFAFAGAEMMIRLGDKDDALKTLEKLQENIAADHWLFAPLRDKLEILFLRQSDYNALLDYYQAWIIRHSNDIDAIRRRASILGRLSRFEEAKKELNAALAKAPSDASIYRALLDLVLAQNQFSEADRLCAEIDRLEPNDPDLYLTWGNAVLKNGALDESTKKTRTAEIWKKILDFRPNDRAAMLLVAEMFAKNRFDSEAESIYRQLVEIEPENPANDELLAEFLLKRNDPGRALQALEHIVEGPRASAENFARKANFLRKKGFLPESLSSLEQAIVLKPERFELWRRKIETLLEAKEYGALTQVISEAESKAQTDDDKNTLFALRLRLLKETDALKPLLDSIDLELCGGERAGSPRRTELYWQKTAALLFLDDPATAAETMIEALENGAVSPLLLQKGGEIAAKSPNPERSLALLNLLCEKDAQNRVAYLRSKAQAQIELGMLDEAVETGKQLAETNANRASDCRFYADLLVDCGRLEDAVAVLRAAVRKDAADPAILARLAELLDHTGKTDEAVNLEWRRFDQASRLEEKLQIVDRLVNCYVKLDRFELFRDRLESLPRNGSEEREYCYCLSRAYMSMKDYSSARATLESLLRMTREKKEEDEFLLGHLSQLAELQNDSEAAVRYQEMLCEITEDAADNQRLLTLYNQAADKDRAKRFLLQKIVPAEPFWKQLETADMFAATEDYETALKILDAMDAKNPDNWEVLARQMMIAGWTGRSGLSLLIDRMDEIPLDEATRSARLLETEMNPNLAAASTPQSAWQIGNIRERSVNALNAPQQLKDFAAQLVLTIYRDRLTLDQGRPSQSALASATKPILTFPTLASGKIAAQCWKARQDESDDKTAEAVGALCGDLERQIAGDLVEIANQADIPSDEALRALYVYEHFIIHLEKNNIVRIGDEKLREKQNVCHSIAMLFALRGDHEWDEEALPLLLSKFRNERNLEKKRGEADFIIKIMESAAAAARTEDRKLFGSFAPDVLSAMKAEGFDEQAQKVQKLFEREYERDYSLLLSVSADAQPLPFQQFEETVHRAEQEAIRQTRSRQEIERAYRLFADFYGRRLNDEFQTAFASLDPKIVDRMKKTAQVWEVLSEKVSFGERVLRAFIRLNRRDLDLESDPTLAALPADIRSSIDESALRYLSAVEQILRRAAATDRLFREQFGSRIDQNGSPSDEITFLQLAKHLKSVKTYRNIVFYLTSKSFYGASAKPNIMAMGKLMEKAAGSFFAIDSVERKFSSERKIDVYRTTDSFLNSFGSAEGNFAAADDHGENDAFLLNLRKMEEILGVLKTIDLTEATEFNSENPADEKLSGLKIKTQDAISRNKAESTNNIPLIGAMAMLASLEGDQENSLVWIEKIPCLRFSDVKTREFIILEMFAGSKESKIVKRKNEAIDRLLGYRLNEDESMILHDVLIREGRKEESVRLFGRLLLTVNRAENVNRLLKGILERKTDEKNYSEEEIVFALRAFRMPFWDKNVMKEWNDLRVRALRVLSGAGKLDEIRSLLEQRIASTPGSVELLLQLADIEIRQGDLPRADEVLAKIEKRLHEDPILLKNYANLLYRAGKNDKAAEYLQKGFLKEPAQFFAERNDYPFWNERLDLEFLRRVDPERLLPLASKTIELLLKEVKSGELNEEASALIQSLWQGENLPAESSRMFQNGAVRQLCVSGEVKFYPLLRSWFIENLRSSAEKSAANGSPSLECRDIHRIVQWNDQSPKTLSSFFLDTAKKAGDLENLLAEVRELEKNKSQENEQERLLFSAAAVFEIQILVKLGRMEEAATRIKEMESDGRFCCEGAKNDALALVCAFGFYSNVDPELLSRYYEKMTEENTHPIYEIFYKNFKEAQKKTIKASSTTNPEIEEK